MAFLSRVGSILKQSVSKQIGTQISASNPSIYQAIRCMSSSKVFIGGLPWSVDDSSLRDTFSQYGEVLEARVIIDREQNRSRGFGFVTFASTEEASSAIQAMDGQDFQGRTVKVNYATERAPRPFSGGGYGGGGYGGGNSGGGYGGGGYGGGNSGGYGGGQNYGGGSGGYGGGNNGGYGGGNSDGYGGGNSGGYGGGNSGAAAAGGNVTADTGLASSLFEGTPGFGHNASNQFGTGSTGPVGNAAGVGDSFFGGGGAAGNVTADTGFGSSGFEGSSGFGHNASDQFGIGSNSPVGDVAGDFDPAVPLQENFGDDKSDDFVRRA